MGGQPHTFSETKKVGYYLVIAWAFLLPPLFKWCLCLCAKYWWYNFLYINNFYPWKLRDKCMNWSWYLQFYIYHLSFDHNFPAFCWFDCCCHSKVLVLQSQAVLVWVDFQASYGFVQFMFQIPILHWTWFMSSLYTNNIVGLLLGYLLYKKFCILLGRYTNWLIYLAMWAAWGLSLASTLAFTAVIVFGMVVTWPNQKISSSYITFSRFGGALDLL